MKSSRVFGMFHAHTFWKLARTLGLVEFPWIPSPEFRLGVVEIRLQICIPELALGNKESKKCAGERSTQCFNITRYLNLNMRGRDLRGKHRVANMVYQAQLHDDFPTKPGIGNSPTDRGCQQYSIQTHHLEKIWANNDLVHGFNH